MNVLKVKISQQGSFPATLDGDAAKDSVSGQSSKGSDNNTDVTGTTGVTGDENGGEDVDISVSSYEISTNENDNDSDGWPNDVENLLGTNPDDFNSKPDGTYDPNFDYSTAYEVPIVEDKVVEEKPPNDSDPCALTVQEIKNYQDEVQRINDILNGAKSPGNGFPAVDLLNHPNRNVEPLKTYIESLIEKKQALSECLYLSVKLACLGEKSSKYTDETAQSASYEASIPGVESLEYEKIEVDEPDEVPVVVEVPVVDEIDPAANTNPAESDPPTVSPPANSGVPNASTPATSAPQTPTDDSIDIQDEEEDDATIITEEPEAEPKEEKQQPESKKSETNYYQIIDDSVRIVASIEFRELLGLDFASPLTSGIIQAGEEMLVTPAAKLLEIQALVRQMTHHNVKDLFDIFTNNKLSSVFRLMYKLHEDSNGELFLQVPTPSNIDDVFNNINTYLEDISAKEVNNSGLTLTSEINEMISHTIIDGNSLLEIGKNYACAVIYYFIFYVRCIQSLKVATEENTTGPQSIANSEEGIENFIEYEASQNTKLTSLLNRDMTLGLDVDEMNSLLVNKNIVRNDIAFSENLSRIFKAILVSGLGLDPTIKSNSSNPSDSKMMDANRELIEIISNNLTMGSHDIQSAVVLFPSNSETFSDGSVNTPDFFTHNYYNFQEDVDVGASLGVTHLIYDTRKRFAEGGNYSEYSNIVKVRKIENIKKLCSFLMAERGLANNLQSVYLTQVGVNINSDLPANLKNIFKTYHTEYNEYFMGEFDNSLESASRSDIVYNTPVKLIKSTKNILDSTTGGPSAGIIKSRLLGSSYNRYQPYMSQTYNIAGGRVSSGVQSSNTAFDAPNEVLVGRSITGLLFETNYYNNEQTEANFDSNTFLNIFDSRERLPNINFLEINSELDLNDLPFRFSGEYYGQGAQTVEDGSVPYIDMLKSLRKYLNSVIDTSYHLFSRASSTITSPQTRLDVIEDFFEELGDLFWDEIGAIETNSETPGQNAMLLNILAHCGSDSDDAPYQEEMFRKTFFVLSAHFAEFLGNRYPSSQEGAGYHDPANVLKGDISIKADNRQQDDIGKTISVGNYGLARPSIKDRLFGMWLKYCAPAGGLFKIFDLKHDGGSPSGADLAIEDYELTGNASNQQLGHGGGFFLVSDGSFFVASKLAAGLGSGNEIKESTKWNNGAGGLRGQLYSEIENSKLNTRVYHSEDIPASPAYIRSVKNIPGEPDFFTDAKIGKGFNSTFRHLECKLTELLFKYADTFRNNFADEGSTKDIDFGSGGYDPLNDSNVFGSSAMFNKSEVNDYDDILGTGTNKFTCLLMFYSILAKIAVWFPTDVIIEAGTKKGKDDDPNKRRFFGPRWSGKYAPVLGNALKGRDIDSGISNFVPQDDPNLQAHYDAVKEIREGIIEHLKEVQNTQVSCLKFLDTICQKLTEEIQTLEASEIPASSTIASTPESDSVFTEHSDLMNLQFSAEQQKKLTTSLAVKLMSPSATFNNYYLPSSKDITSHQVAKMMKYFSQTGRNYLSNEISMGDSNKNRSNKLIFSVGIPNGLVGRLMLENPAVQSLGYNSVIPKSNSLLKLTVHKINLLNPEDIKYIPKSYFFDAAKFVFNNSILLPDDPLREFDSTALMTQLSDDKFVEQSRLYHIGRDANGSMRIAYINGQSMRALGQGLVDAGGEYQKKDIAESLLMNHLTDYYLKVYMKVMMGIDVDEDIYSFSSKKDITLYAGNDPANENFFMRNFYSKMATILNSMESSNYSDPSYLYEFNRLVNVARRSNMFAPEKYFNRTILPKTFDRVFSVLIDEGDFIPVAAYDQKTNQINLENGYGEAAKEIAINAFNDFSDTQQMIIPSVDGSGHTLNSTPEDFNTILGQSFVIDENDVTDETIYQYYCTIEAIASEDYNIIKELESETNNIPTSEGGELEYMSSIFGPSDNISNDTSNTLSDATTGGASANTLDSVDVSEGGQYVGVNAMAVPNTDD